MHGDGRWREKRQTGASISSLAWHIPAYPDPWSRSAVVLTLTDRLMARRDAGAAVSCKTTKTQGTWWLIMHGMESFRSDPNLRNHTGLGRFLPAATNPVTTGIWLFAEYHILCRVFYFGHSAKSSLPSATQKTLGKRKHSAKKLFAECFIFDTRQRVSLPSVFF
jgi:hypothetical protein